MTELAPLSKNQQTAIDFALDRAGSAWFMPPGMGKTRSWLEVIEQTPGRTLVIAPKLVCMDTWPRENRKWGHKFPMRFLHGRERHLRGKELVSLINYDAIPWLVSQLEQVRVPPYEQVIFDELSKMKNPLSKRFKEWLKVGARIPAKSGGTGTPVGAHLKDLFGELRVCDNGRALGADYEKFLRNYFSADQYTRALTPYPDSERAIVERIRDTVISFDINDLDMPPLTHIPVQLNLPANVRAAYEEMRAESVVENLDLYAANAAVRSGKLRQMASGGVLDTNKERRYLHDVKADHLKEILDEHDGRPVMVFFEFLSDYRTICRVLRREVPALYGATSTRDAATTVRRWNAGHLPVLAVHPRSAAYGLNMQDSGNVIVWYTVPWSFEMVNQGTARLWRQGQQRNVLCHYLIVGDTEDERVFARVTARADTHKRVMKGLL